MMDDALRVMKICIAEARKAKGFTKTNPLVGAAVVKNSQVISTGIHERFGEAHAEVNALDKAGSLTFGADLFVTLEPCSSFGKTPPCVNKIIECGIKRVFIGVVDVNPKHAGLGIRKLRQAGVEVHVGVALQECAELSEDFIKSQIYKTPYVTIKTATSLDGKIATYARDSKWITCEESRKLVHEMRGKADVVLTGIGTVLADDPMLTDRTKNAKRQPMRVVLDRLCRTPATSALAQSAKDIPLTIFISEFAPNENISKLLDVGANIITVPTTNQGSVDIKSVLTSLHDMQVMNVLVESGSILAGSFHDEGLIDAAKSFIAPKIIGGDKAPCAFAGYGIRLMKDVGEFASFSMKKSGSDILVSARIKDYAHIACVATQIFMEKG